MTERLGSWVVLLLLLCTPGWTLSDKKWVWGMDAGVVQPLGPLADWLDPVPFGRASVRLPYAGNSFFLWTALGYSRMDGPDSPASLHHAVGQFGLTWQKAYWGLGSGAGLYYVRAHHKRTERALLLDDNETEFGWYLRALGPSWSLGGGWSHGFSADAHLIWTLPRHSYLLWVGWGLVWSVP